MFSKIVSYSCIDIHNQENVKFIKYKIRLKYFYFQNGGGLNHTDMNVMGAWKRGVTGKNVVITILDDGIERTHDDLKDNYVSWILLSCNKPHSLLTLSHIKKCSQNPLQQITFENIVKPCVISPFATMFSTRFNN